MFVRELINKKNKFYGVSVYNSTLIVNDGKYVKDDFQRHRCSSCYTFESSSESAMKKAQKLIADRLKQGFNETQESLSYRHFENSSGKRTKFWNIRLLDDICVVNYGSPGEHPRYRNTGTWQTKYFDSAEQALAFYFKSIENKLNGGYKERFARKTDYSVAPETTRTTKKRQSKRSGKTTADLNQGEFVFDDGKSHKFWNIELTGKSHTVHFGRVGTNGQTRTKEFADETAARKSFDKLIAEKTGKGYVTQATKAPAKKATTQKSKATKKVKASPKPERPEPPPVVTKVTHVINLEPRDWFWAMWRDPDPLPTPEPKPFEKEKCLDSIRSVRSSRGTYTVPIPDGPFTPQEAEFWMVAQHLQNHHRTPKSLCDSLAKKKFEADWTAERMVRRQKRDRFWRTDLVAQVLGPEQFTELVLTLPKPESEIAVFRQHTLPYLARPVRQKLGEQAAKMALAVKPPKRYHDSFPSAWLLASVLGCHDAVESILQVNLPSGYWYSVQEVIWGLGSAQRVEEELDRLNEESRLWLQDHQLRALLAHMETRRLDLARDAVIGSSKSWGSQRERAKVLALVKDPAAAPFMLELRLAGKSGDVVTEWLDREVGNAVTGLVPVAASKGQLADAAKAYLREKQRLGFGKVIQKALKSIPKADAQRLHETTLNVPELGPPLDDKTTPKKLKPLLVEAESLSRLKDSDWAVVEKLPPVAVGKFRLASEQVDALLLALQRSEFEQPHPLLAEVRRQADGEMLAEFVWALFDLWLANDAPSKHKWAMRALAFLGDDSIALKLTPLIRKWPGESQHPRAVLGVDCLRAIGSEVALMQLSGIAQKVKFKALQRKAMECVEAIAEEKGMTRDELEDRVVPDCGLDETGTRWFDYGPRRFRFALDGDNRPVIRDEDGKLRKDLPKPASKDDTQKATQSADDWKQLKKQIREVVKIQAARLEQALITGRRWTVPDFETLLVRHPLMTNFARRLLWAGFDKKNQLRKTFRVTDECDFADLDDQDISLAACESIGIVHPLHLKENECAKWGELFADYEIVPPFPQLGRALHQLSAAEKKQLSFARFEGLKIPAHTMLGILNRNGWTRGMPQDNGVFREHYKHFFAADLTVSIEYDNGISISFYEGEDDQTVENCVFLRGIYKPRGWPNHKGEVKLGAVDPVIVSEILSDLIELESKAV